MHWKTPLLTLRNSLKHWKQNILVSFHVHSNCYPSQHLIPSAAGIPDMSLLFPDKDDPPEPNLAEYAALDMAALDTVREIGSRYCMSLEALLQSTPGMETGYLPEETAKETLIGVSIFFLILLIYLQPVP